MMMMMVMTRRSPQLVKTSQGKQDETAAADEDKSYLHGGGVRHQFDLSAPRKSPPQITFSETLHLGCFWVGGVTLGQGEDGGRIPSS